MAQVIFRPALRALISARFGIVSIEMTAYENARLDALNASGSRL
jgi:hypothetical protein